MASSMKSTKLFNFRTNLRLLPNSSVPNSIKLVRQYSNALATATSPSPQVENETATSVNYPPVKPRYPPGRWGNLNPTSAWRLHSIADSLKKIPSVKLRLEELAGVENKVLWVVEPFDKRPNNLAFKQYLTKTHIVHGLPDLYRELNVDSVYDEVKDILPEIIAEDLQRVYKAKLEPDLHDILYVDVEKYKAQRVIGTLVRALRARLARDHVHLRTSQIDERVRVETSWNVTGFGGEKNPTKGKAAWMQDNDKKDVGILRFQFKSKPEFQIRTEQPTSPVVSMDDALCVSQPIPFVDYTPATAGLNYIHDRPISMSGHWVGAPCEWTHLSVHTMPGVAYAKMSRLGEDYARMSELIYGMTAGFGSCVAQAHNQGFCFLMDLTYPITTQCLVTDGRWLRLFVYQLNTLQLWKTDGPEGNPLRNIVWASAPVPMYEGIEPDGRLRGVNGDAFKLLIKCLALRPGGVGEGVDLRPYIEEGANTNVKQYINNKGEEVLPAKVIGRFEYRKNSVYF